MAEWVKVPPMKIRRPIGIAALLAIGLLALFLPGRGHQQSMPSAAGVDVGGSTSRGIVAADDLDGILPDRLPGLGKRQWDRPMAAGYGGARIASSHVGWTLGRFEAHAIAWPVSPARVRDEAIVRGPLATGPPRA
jgi:hypothetical protein